MHVFDGIIQVFSLFANAALHSGAIRMDILFMTCK
jgi:hypothetical protein